MVADSKAVDCVTWGPGVFGYADSDSSADSSGVDSDSDEEGPEAHTGLAKVGAWHRPVGESRLSRLDTPSSECCVVFFNPKP